MRHHPSAQDVGVRRHIERANSYTATAIRAVDGSVMKQPVQQALAEGNFHKVPVLAGNNRDEFNWFIALNELAAGKPLRAEEYVPTLIKQYGEEKGQKIAAAYPLAKYGSPSEALAAAQTSWFFVCPSFRAMRSIAKHAPVYAYEFIDTQAPPAFKPVSFPYGAGHTLEIQYLFPRFHGARGTPHDLSGAQARLSTEMTGYWTRFAAKGDPNGGSAPRWDRFTGKEGPVQLLSPAGTRTAADTGVDRMCGFWDAF
jgi:para-nitrobenzyl esterase